jgi:hypothetical protein
MTNSTLLDLTFQFLKAHQKALSASLVISALPKLLKVLIVAKHASQRFVPVSAGSDASSVVSAFVRNAQMILLPKTLKLKTVLLPRRLHLNLLGQIQVFSTSFAAVKQSNAILVTFVHQKAIVTIYPATNVVERSTAAARVSHVANATTIRALGAVRLLEQRHPNCILGRALIRRVSSARGLHRCFLIFVTIVARVFPHNAFSLS